MFGPRGHGVRFGFSNPHDPDRTPDWPGGGGGVWHKALVVGSVSLWRRLLASCL